MIISLHRTAVTFAVGLAIAAGGATSSQAQGSFDVAALPEANPGECFAKVLVPAQYKEVDQKVVTREASQRLEITPARYEWVEEEVVVRPGYQKLQSVPAKMKTVSETVVLEPARKVWRAGKASNATIARDITVAAAVAEGLPRDAEAGTCYSQFFQAPRFEEMENEVVVREATKKFQTTAPTYEWVEEKVMVKPASTRMVEVPATYDTVTEKVLVRAAYATWKKGRGPIERVDNSTGEIMCRVEVPAEYKTVTRRIVKTAATSKTVEVPAEYKTVRVQKLVNAPAEKAVEIAAQKATFKSRVEKSPAVIGWRPVGTTGPGENTGKLLCRAELAPTTKTVSREVVETPASVQKVDVPAKTQRMKVRKLLAKASENRIAIPEKSEMVTRREKLSDEKLAWRPVLCETNATRDTVTDIQRALKTAGFDPGPIDGVIGRETMAAADAFQVAKRLERGGLTHKTLEALGVKLKTQ